MARKRKQTEQAPVILAELPRDPEALTSEEAAAVKGGSAEMTSKIMANAHEMKKALIGNFPR